MSGINISNRTYFVGAGYERKIPGSILGMQIEVFAARFPDGQWDMFVQVGGGQSYGGGVWEGTIGTDSVEQTGGQERVDDEDAPRMWSDRIVGWSAETGGAFGIPGLTPVAIGYEIDIPLAGSQAPKSHSDFRDVFSSLGDKRIDQLYGGAIQDAEGNEFKFSTRTVTVGPPLPGYSNFINYTFKLSDFANGIKTAATVIPGLENIDLQTVIESSKKLLGEQVEILKEKIGIDGLENETIRNFVQHGLVPNPLRDDGPKCFVAGTQIEMSDGSLKPIEEVAVGDEVLAFDEIESKGQGTKQVRRVTDTFINEDKQIIDFMGLKVTPGHAFLSGDGSFKQLIDILREDGTVVLEDGQAVRARTGMPVDGKDDQIIPVGYSDAGELELTQMRAGVVYGTRNGEAYTLGGMMHERGYHLRTDGKFINADGDVKTAYWEWGKPDDQLIAGQYALYDGLNELQID